MGKKEGLCVCDTQRIDLRLETKMDFWEGGWGRLKAQKKSAVDSFPPRRLCSIIGSGCTIPKNSEKHLELFATLSLFLDLGPMQKETSGWRTGRVQHWESPCWKGIVVPKFVPKRRDQNALGNAQGQDCSLSLSALLSWSSEQESKRNLHGSVLQNLPLRSSMWHLVPS